MSSSRSWTRPDRGFTSPMIALISVDLPAPFGPTIVTISPARTSIDTPLRMSTSGTYPATRASVRSTVSATASAIGPLRERRPELGIDRCLAAQIRLDHLLVVANLVRRTLGDHAALRH